MMPSGCSRKGNGDWWLGAGGHRKAIHHHHEEAAQEQRDRSADASPRLRRGSRREGYSNPTWRRIDTESE
jgi:hypothetical protein